MFMEGEWKEGKRQILSRVLRKPDEVVKETLRSWMQVRTK
jgi:hypothetical protein